MVEEKKTLSIVELIGEPSTTLEGMMWEEANVCRGSVLNSKTDTDYCTNYNQCMYQVYEAEPKRMKCGYSHDHFSIGGITPV